MDYIKAKQFAIRAHGDQKYDNMPYAFHLAMVAEIAVVSLKWARCPWSIQEIHDVAWLHDILEDTDITYEELKKEFGPTIADAVKSLSEPKEGNRTERHAVTYPQIRENGLSLYIKLCDRLANVMYGKKNDMYKKEHESFVTALWDGKKDADNDWDAIIIELWNKIEEILFNK